MAALLTVALLGGLIVVPSADPADAQVVSYSLVVSSSAVRSNPQPLAGATVSGNVYVFTTPDTADITSVRFWVDNPNHTGSPAKTENNGPYDLAGGTVATANPFNTNNLANGTHTITAQIVTGPTSQYITATYTIQNGGGSNCSTSQPVTTVMSTEKREPRRPASPDVHRPTRLIRMIRPAVSHTQRFTSARGTPAASTAAASRSAGCRAPW